MTDTPFGLARTRQRPMGGAGRGHSRTTTRPEAHIPIHWAARDEVVSQYAGWVARKGATEPEPWFTRPVKKLVDYGRDDHPADDPDHAQVTWAIAVLDDCDGCDDLRVELTVEELGRPGTGLVAHLAPETARRLQAALRMALREVGEDSGA